MRAQPFLLLPLAWALVAAQAVASSHSQEARDWGNRQLQEQRQQQQQQFDREKQSYGAHTAPGSGGAPGGPVGGSAGDLRPLRAELERRPALPASKNPLLGRWALPGAGGANHAGLAGQLENLLGGSTCSMLFGAGPIEFRPDTVVNASGQASFGSVQYRAGKGNNIFLLPQKRVLVGVEMQSRDRAMVMEGTTCLLSRIGAASVDPAGAAGPRSAPAAVRAPQPAAPAAPTTGTVFSGAAFRCADGHVYHVTGCRGGDCDVTAWQLPAVTRFPPMSVKPIAQIAEQVKACEAGGLRYGDDNKPVFIR